MTGDTSSAVRAVAAIGPPTVRPRTLLSIQYLRGFAAVSVLVTHTSWTRSDLGQAGVDIFFVISGFVMVMVSDRSTSPGAFLIARIVRIVPLYWLATLALAALHWGSDGTGHIVLSLLFWPHSGPSGHGWPVVIAGWTLVYEAFFYVLFALFLPLTRNLATLSAVLVGLCTLGWLFSPPGALGVYSSPIMLEFVAGAWICRAWQRGTTLPRWAAICLATVGAAALAMQAPLPVSEAWRFALYGGPAALIVMGLVAFETSGRFPRISILRRLGDSSYALYLTHATVLTIALPLFKPYPLVLALPAVIGVCAIVGFIVYYTIERPVQRSLKTMLPRALRPNQATGKPIHPLAAGTADT